MCTRAQCIVKNFSLGIFQEMRYEKVDIFAFYFETPLSCPHSYDVTYCSLNVAVIAAVLLNNNKWKGFIPSFIQRGVFIKFVLNA